MYCSEHRATKGAELEGMAGKGDSSNMQNMGSSLWVGCLLLFGSVEQL